jgi:CheY-like chemotaxis protein
MTMQESPVLLLVEDDFLVRMTLVDALTDAGFEVLEAGDAQEALAVVCDRQDIAAMLTDINLPGGADGFTLARAVRVLRPTLPVVYASGRYGVPEHGRMVEGARFLAKPFTPALAAATLRELMAEENGDQTGPAGPREIVAGIGTLRAGPHA